MPLTATIEDVLEISKAEALKAGKKILGITVSEPRYVLVPDDDDPAAQLEFVVDVQLIDGISQAIVPGASGQGLAVIENILIAHEAAGEILADLHVPVEIEKNVGGQLQVVNRAKVQLPTLSVRALTYKRMKLEHLAELDIRSGGTFDPFGNPVDFEEEVGGVVIGVVVESKFRQSTVAELALNDSGDFIGLGVNPLQRIIQKTTRHWTVEAEDSVEPTESITVT